MAHEVVQQVEVLVPRLIAGADETERLGKLSQESVAVIREAGVMRMLQPKDFGGFAAHPRDFAEAVMAVAKYCGASGWVCGVGGVHPLELALCDRRVQEEVWGENLDTWMASPYAPTGVAVPTDGGYVLNGHWQFSSGTDHCDWIFLGALVGDAEGQPLNPPRSLHVILPRKDYTIVDDSWNVVGLSGTGSKDILVENAFIPTYRTIDAAEVAEGEIAAERAGRADTVYRLPFWSVFPLGITAAVIGITEGLLAQHLDYQRDWVTGMGTKAREDPYILYSISEAAAEIAASRTQLIDGITRAYEISEAGKPVSFELRAEIRRNQVRCAWRAVTAADQIFARSGGNALRKDKPMQRLPRGQRVSDSRRWLTGGGAGGTTVSEPVSSLKQRTPTWTRLRDDPRVALGLRLRELLDPRRHGAKPHDAARIRPAEQPLLGLPRQAEARSPCVARPRRRVQSLQ